MFGFYPNVLDRACRAEAGGGLKNRKRRGRCL